MPYPINLSPNELNLIHELAKSYKSNLLDKQFTFFYNDSQSNHLASVTVKFRKRNFAHLVGLSKNPNSLNSADKIFDAALSNTIRSNDCFTTHGKQTTIEKISNAQSIFDLVARCNEISVLDTDVVNITSDSIVGGKPATTFSFVDVGEDTLVPNSLLNGNIKENSGQNPVNKILCTLVETPSVDDLSIYEMSLGRINENISARQAKYIISMLDRHNADGVAGSLVDDKKYQQLKEISNQTELCLTDILGLSDELIQEYRELDKHDILNPSASIESECDAHGDYKFSSMINSPLLSEPNVVYTEDEYSDLCDVLLTYKQDIEGYDKAQDKQLYLADLVLDIRDNDEKMLFYGLDGEELAKQVDIATSIIKENSKQHFEQTADKLKDVQTHDFIDAQGLSDEVNPARSVDAQTVKSVRWLEDIKTPEDVYDWVEAVDNAMMELVSDPVNPTQEFLDGLKFERKIFGDLDKNEERKVFNLTFDGDKILYDDAIAVLRDKFEVDLEKLRVAVEVWKDVRNDAMLPVDDSYVVMISDNDAYGLKQFYKMNNTLGSNNEVIYEDTVVLQDLIDEQFIDEINQDFNSRQFEILSDGEKIPLDVVQSQSQRSLSSDRNKQKQKKALKQTTQAYRKTEQFDQSRNSRERVNETREEAIARRKAEVRANRLSPAESIRQATKRTEARNAKLKQSQNENKKPSL